MRRKLWHAQLDIRVPTLPKKIPRPNEGRGILVKILPADFLQRKRLENPKDRLW